MSLARLFGRTLSSGGAGGFEFDLQEPEDVRALGSTLEREVETARRRGLGTLKRKVPTYAKRDIREEYRLKAGRIAKGLTIRYNRQGIKLVGKARGINAIEFGATWSRRSKTGARWAARRGDAKYQHEGEFIATGKNGVKLVFSRGGKGAVRNKNDVLPRLPLRSIYGPSIGQMLKHGQRPERIATFAQDTLASEYDRLLFNDRSTP